jgi:hypothetical protein
LHFGPASSNFIHSAEPGGSPYQNIQEAYASYLAPAGKGLQVDAGVFVTPAGAEVIEAKDNANYSRGLLFSLAIPYYHSGVRVTYSPSDKFTVMGGLVNGWNDIVENNSGKTTMASLTKAVEQAVDHRELHVRPEQADTTDSEHRWRHLSTPSPRSPRRRRSASRPTTTTARTAWARRMSWQGIAAYLKYQANKIIAISLGSSITTILMARRRRLPRSSRVHGDSRVQRLGQPDPASISRRLVRSAGVHEPRRQ